DPDRAGGRLFVVATPIRNLADVTLRAIEVLRAVPLVAAEDTRLTRRLFARHGIETRLISYHARSAPSREAELVRHLASGADLALVTDAGTPGVSDPGEGLVVAWAEAGGTVVPIPGASAVLAAIVASGVAGARWGFEGFLPRSGRDRRERLARIASDDRATVIFEAPTRIAATLRDLAAACGDGRRGAVCRELTKLHETIVRGTLGDLARLAHEGDIPARGEFVVVVAPGAVAPGGGAAPGIADDTTRLQEALAAVERLTAAGAARGDAAREVSAATGIPRRRLYGAPDRGEPRSAARRDSNGTEPRANR
ncbi:MAG TPA: 16S rRNA (cytidine(1402)-2'-O)-methyltransferase, partial [Candidatus Limnocylindrales bacterium]